jgi:predicted dehydrogenase
MGYAHLPGWIHAGVQVKGILANDPENAQKLAEQCGATVFSRLEDLLPVIDILDICVPTPLHRVFTIAAAEAGKHIFCEKPIARTVEEGQAMIAACNRAQVRLFVGQVVRFFPQYRSVYDVLRAGKIGNLAVLRLTRASYRPHKEGDNWFADFARSGGPLLDMLVHDYDYARWLGGEVERVYTRCSPPDSGGISDYVQVLLRFRSGAIAHIEGGWAYPPGVFRTKIEAAGDGGLIEWESDTSAPITTYLKAQPGQTAEVGLPLSPLEVDPYQAIIAHFYDALLHDRPFSVTPEDALAALQIGIAAIESAATGTPVTLTREA